MFQESYTAYGGLLGSTHNKRVSQGFGEGQGMSSALRAGMLVVSVLLLQSCGGDDEGGNDGGGGGNGPRVTASTNSVDVEGSPGDSAPVASIMLTIANPPAEGLSVQGNFSTQGIDQVYLNQSSATQAELQVVFKVPGALIEDTYEDTIDLQVCRDAACNREISGSPLTIRTSYQVSGDDVVVSLDRQSLDVTLDQRDQNTHSETIGLVLDAPSPAVCMSTTRAACKRYTSIRRASTPIPPRTCPSCS
jgi:hypothetical protein